MTAKVGLTGGIGSGKSSVAQLFADQGVLVIDADFIARQVTSQGTYGLSAIESHFGTGVLHPDGSLDRAVLGEIIFSSRNERKWLERLLHPLIRTEMDRQADDCSDPFCILEIPLLVETDRQHDMECVVVVHCPRETRIDRLMTNRCMNRAEIERVMDQQASDDERLMVADYIIQNDVDRDTLARRFHSVHAELTDRFPHQR